LASATQARPRRADASCGGKRVFPEDKAMSREIETRTNLVRLDDEGILRVRAKPHAALELIDAQELTAAEMTLIEGQKRPILVDLRSIKSMTRECRLYFAGPEPAKIHLAGALVIHTPFGKALGNFFMGFNKPIVPTRLFTNDEEALGWLRTYLSASAPAAG
jgi:hypothetical protein